MDRAETRLTAGAGPMPQRRMTVITPTDQILTELRDAAAPFDKARAASSPGVYAWFLADGAALKGISNPGHATLYLGASGNLAEREFETHFAAGKSGFSTLRRSLGAILKDELGLRCRPRGPGPSKSNFTNYRFDDPGEARLSQWMRDNLRVGVRQLDGPRAREGELIALACPPLNLTGWANPDARSIRELRKACADEARSKRR